MAIQTCCQKCGAIEAPLGIYFGALKNQQLNDPCSSIQTSSLQCIPKRSSLCVDERSSADQDLTGKFVSIRCRSLQYVAKRSPSSIYISSCFQENNDCAHVTIPGCHLQDIAICPSFCDNVYLSFDQCFDHILATSRRRCL